MSRRDRTTGLPRHSERSAAAQESTFLGMRWSERHTRFSILGGAALLLILVAALIGYNWYHDNVVMPNRVVLRVDDREFKLDYFTERLPSFAQANPSLSAGFREPALLSKIEEEALTIIAANERGIDTSNEAVTQWIADDLGVPVGGSGSSFDTLYRQRLRGLGLSNDEYRQLATAELADERLREVLQEERGEVGPMYTLRVVSLNTEEEAAGIRERIEGGEDMGTIAQTESNDLQSRQEDGLTPPTPTELFQEDVQEVITAAEHGELLGPIEVGNSWWVLRIERFQEDGTYSENHRTQLSEVDLVALIEETRDNVEVVKRLGTDEIEWAYENVDAVSAPSGQ